MTKERLCQYRQLIKELKRLEEQICSLEARCQAKANFITNMPRGGVHKDNLVNLVDAKKVKFRKRGIHMNYLKKSNVTLEEFKKVQVKDMDDTDWICQDVANILARMLHSRVKKRSLMGTYKVIAYKSKYGKKITYYWNKRPKQQKCMWLIKGCVRFYGDAYGITIYNIKKYDIYEEYGCRQSSISYPGKIGKTLVNFWVPNFTIALDKDEISDKPTVVLRQTIEKKIRNAFK